MRHLITMADLTPAEIEHIFAIAGDLKAKFTAGVRQPLLPGRVLALLFEKPSLRTRVSFESCMAHLGGTSLFLGEEVGFRHRESIADFGRVMGEYVDAIVVRARRHATVVELAEYCTCSVINGLTDISHPCQAMADLFTLRELLGKVRGHTVAWVGDGNNVARSLAMGCGKLGIRFAMATPSAFRFPKEYMETLRREVPDLDLMVTDDPREAVHDAAAVYTDVWASMGQESQSEHRRQVFKSYQVTAELMSHAQRGCYFMHCLPARRGEEVTDEVLDGPQSVVVQQASNRLHIQKGILAWLLGAKP